MWTKTGVGMSDLIDRKKAIETLKEYEVVESDNFTKVDFLSMMTVATIASCIEAIEELPTAEPEILTIEEVSNQLGCVTIQSALYWFELLKTLDLLGFAIIRKETR